MRPHALHLTNYLKLERIQYLFLSNTAASTKSTGWPERSLGSASIHTAQPKSQLNRDAPKNDYRNPDFLPLGYGSTVCTEINNMHEVKLGLKIVKRKKGGGEELGAWANNLVFLWQNNGNFFK